MLTQGNSRGRWACEATKGECKIKYRRKDCYISPNSRNWGGGGSRQEIELEEGKTIKTKNSRVVLENCCVRGKVKLPAFYSPKKVCVFTDTV